MAKKATKKKKTDSLMQHIYKTSYGSRKKILDKRAGKRGVN